MFDCKCCCAAEAEYTCDICGGKNTQIYQEEYSIAQTAITMGALRNIYKTKKKIQANKLQLKSVICNDIATQYGV